MQDPLQQLAWLSVDILDLVSWVVFSSAPLVLASELEYGREVNLRPALPEEVAVIVEDDLWPLLPSFLQ